MMPLKITLSKRKRGLKREKKKKKTIQREKIWQLTSNDWACPSMSKNNWKWETDKRQSINLGICLKISYHEGKNFNREK